MAVVVVAVTANEQEQSASRSNRGGRAAKNAIVSGDKRSKYRSRAWKKMTVYSVVRINLFKGCVM